MNTFKTFKKFKKIQRTIKRTPINSPPILKRKIPNTIEIEALILSPLLLLTPQIDVTHNSEVGVLSLSHVLNFNDKITTPLTHLTLCPSCPDQLLKTET